MIEKDNIKLEEHLLSKLWLAFQDRESLSMNPDEFIELFRPVIIQQLEIDDKTLDSEQTKQNYHETLMDFFRILGAPCSEKSAKNLAKKIILQVREGLASA